MSTSITCAIWKYVVPTIVFLGYVGNILTLITATSKHVSKSSFTVYLAALAVVDLLTINVHGLIMWVAAVFGVYVQTHSSVTCRFVKFFFFLLPTLGAWILVIINIERMVCLTRPYAAACWSRIETAVKVVSVILAAVTAFDSHLIYGSTIVNIGNASYCGIINDNYYWYFYTHYWPIIDVCVSFVLPATLIVTTNAVAVMTVFRSSRHAGAGGDMASSRRNKALLRTTLLISVAFILLIGTAFIAFYLFGGESVFSGEGSPKEDVVVAVSVCLYLLNSTINFLLYVMTGSRYRQNLKKALCVKWSHAQSDS